MATPKLIEPRILLPTTETFSHPFPFLLYSQQIGNGPGLDVYNR